LKNGRISRHIIGRPKKCHTHYNARTKRCVLSSKSAKKTKTQKRTNRKKTPELICVPTKFKDLVENCACNSQWQRKQKIGSGDFGQVYRACAVDGCDYVMKVQKFDKFAKAELHTYLGLKDLRVAPKLYAAWRCRGMLYIVIERLFECTRPLAQIKLRVRQLAEKMAENGWLHGDLHQDNVMCTDKNRLVLIDFGYAVQRGKGPYPTHPGQSYTDIKKEQQQMLNEYS